MTTFEFRSRIVIDHSVAPPFVGGGTSSDNKTSGFASVQADEVNKITAIKALKYKKEFGFTDVLPVLFTIYFSDV